MAELIDLMRQAGVQWPEGAEYAAQDGDGDGLLCFYRKTPKRSAPGSRVWTSRNMMLADHSFLDQVADDWREPVSREQWEAV